MYFIFFKEEGFELLVIYFKMEHEEVTFIK